MKFYRKKQCHPELVSGRVSKNFVLAKWPKSALGLHLNEIYQIIWATNIT
jgi:hypothetical protein